MSTGLRSPPATYDNWRLSEDSRHFLLKKHRPADAAEGARVVAKFEELVGEDTMRNEYLLRAIFPPGWCRR